ncbi:30S ribosomal protein S5 alanine N-acetyltransferase [Planotetraspora thailandica]|uniref:30S ribosomal protein S5 alanine N-acetyltransferase n=1 Tax=Planotetraspora thailandica TaxID=487172 RepID=A0A8J3V3V4_9ACTN|nr:GNAT family protein [Planotetraspora thailandica]GII56288.1 30S ribosomal protein S5 alanine N-acetyltransferase [Planotetraspora thailandica]
MTTFDIPVRLETGRLVLRPHGLADYDQVATLVMNGDASTALPPGRPSAVEEIKEWLTDGVHGLRRSGKGVHLAIFTKDGELVGGINLHGTDWETGITEVGYGVSPKFRGQGIAPEAVRAVTRWGFSLGLHRVEIRTTPENEASQRVAAKAGFTYEGRLRQAQREDDELHDLLVFSFLADEAAD